MNQLQCDLNAISDVMYRRVISQRERIIEAFIAETGCKPSEAIQVEAIWREEPRYSIVNEVRQILPVTSTAQALDVMMRGLESVLNERGFTRDS